MITIANANALHIPLPDRSVQCVVTSPPYWGLRDYGTAKWEGGSEECDHVMSDDKQYDNYAAASTLGGGKSNQVNGGSKRGFERICPRCGAHRIDAQIGLESTPAEYVAHIVAVMRECWRVLKDDGTLWLNLGDSYATNGVKGSGGPCVLPGAGKQMTEDRYKVGIKMTLGDGLKPKDLCGIPWRVAFALQDAGWYLRSDIIWHKPNPMPESVTDRPTKSHEYVFLLTKQARYYYDAEAIREPISESTIERWNGIPARKNASPQGLKAGSVTGESAMGANPSGRNRRSVWTIATSPYSGAHFACFPPALIEPMILAGTSARGECPHCGKAWARVVEKETGEKSDSLNPSREAIGHERIPRGHSSHQPGWRKLKPDVINDVSWRPSCFCPPHKPIPQTVLDPFAGSGTTGQVAVKHGRRAVLLDLNTKYIGLQFERTNGVQVTMPL